MELKVGDKAPQFSLLTDSDKLLSLADLKGKHVILYFYPKDDTPGCTKEACDFRDMANDFKHNNAVVLGVSKDNLKSHQKFKLKYELPFTLLSDETGKTCEDYGVIVEKINYGKKYMGIDRSTFLIDESGVIRNIWRKVKVDGHIDDILKLLKR